MPKGEARGGVHKIGTDTKRAGNRGKGRPKGALNKVTTAAKEAFRLAFDKMGGTDALAAWAAENPTEFYKLYAKLIPIDLTTGERPMDALTKWKFGDREVTF